MCILLMYIKIEANAVKCIEFSKYLSIILCQFQHVEVLKYCIALEINIKIQR